MTDTKIAPQWILDALAILHEQRDKLQAQYDALERVAEQARRACVVPQQLLDKVKDAIQALNHAAEWSSGTVWEVPL